MAGVSTGLNEVVAAAAASSIEDTACTPTTTAAITLQSVFSNAVVQPPVGEPSTGLIQEALRKLSSLWETQLTDIENVTEEHWRNPEFPLARLKKIMRMDEDVKMISGEVPILLSKAIEIFVTELTLRAWMQTAESKRRTVQRSDIAMAIAKNDMFDFLIDIVPREEIQSKSRTSIGNSTATSTRLNQAEPSSDDSNPLLQPEVLQSYLQMLYQQSDTEGGEGGDNASNLMATSTLLQQQVQLLQQLIQLQQQMQRQEQEEQEQQSEEEDQLMSVQAQQHLQLPQQPQVMPASSDVLHQSPAELGRVLGGGGEQLVKEATIGVHREGLSGTGAIGLQSLSSLGFNPSSGIHGPQQD